MFFLIASMVMCWFKMMPLFLGQFWKISAVKEKVAVGGNCFIVRAVEVLIIDTENCVY